MLVRGGSDVFVGEGGLRVRVGFGVFVFTGGAGEKVLVGMKVIVMVGRG